MAATVLDGDVDVRGTITPRGFACPASSVGSAGFSGSDPLVSSKRYHRHNRVFAQVHGSAASAERRAIHVAKGAGSVLVARAGVVVACIGDSTISVDVRLNGTTILTAPISIDSGDVAYAKVSGSIPVATYSAGDVLEVVVTVTAGTGTLGQGLFVDVVCDEAA